MYDECMLLDFILTNDTAVDHLKLVQRLFLLSIVDGGRFSITVQMTVVSKNEVTRTPRFDVFTWRKRESVDPIDLQRRVRRIPQRLDRGERKLIRLIQSNLT